MYTYTNEELEECQKRIRELSRVEGMSIELKYSLDILTDCDPYMAGQVFIAKSIIDLYFKYLEKKFNEEYHEQTYP